MAIGLFTTAISAAFVDFRFFSCSLFDVNFELTLSRHSRSIGEAFLPLSTDPLLEAK